MQEIYQRKRDLLICGNIGISPTTREEFVREAFSMPVYPVSGTIDLIGIPAIVSAKEDSAIAEVYESASFAAIDGMPLVRIAQKHGFLCERCAAPDIMGMMFEESIKQNKTNYFYGGKNDEVLRLLRENLEKQFPGIHIAGMFSPPFRPLTESEDKEVCAQINRIKPDFIWVGIGAPKQEKWMKDHREKIPGSVMLGVGAGFDFYAGTLDKAPKWMEKACLEWLYRLLKEPKRLWKRYIIGGIKFLYYYIYNRRKHKRMKI